jgi:peroxiredoxin
MELIAPRYSIRGYLLPASASAKPWDVLLSDMNLKNVNPPPRSPSDALKEAESLNASLNIRLTRYREQSRTLRSDFAQAYDELIARLGSLDRGEVGPQIGERLEEFNLPDEGGRLVSLSSMLQSGPAVISINRGHWCPYCKLELRSLAAVDGDIRRLGARTVSIMPDSAQFTGDLAKKNELPFPVLTDIDLGYSLALGLIFWVGGEIQRLYKEAGVELEKYHGNQGHFLPMAAKFIVGQDGLVKARQVNIEFRERMEPEAIIAVLEGMHAAG